GELDEVAGAVEFREVAFGYGKTPLITDLNLRVEPGELVAIVGPTGAGKTTLVNLLMRFYDVDAGAILLDGTDISTVSRPRCVSRSAWCCRTPCCFRVRSSTILPTVDPMPRMS